jgi:hypothetical protein
MCILIYKPENVALPSKDTLKTSWENNNMGAGFCFDDGNKITVHKGFMKFKPLYKALMKTDDSKPMLIHFRLATHGLVDGTATHPFPCSSEISELKLLSYTTGMAIAHNGIVPGYGNNKDDNLSDTQDFIKNCLSGLKDVIFRGEVQKLILDATDSKWGIMVPGRVALLGKFMESGGCLYSNDGYKPIPKAWESYYKNQFGYPSFEETDYPYWSGKSWNKKDENPEEIKVKENWEIDYPFDILTNEEIKFCQKYGKGGDCWMCEHLDETTNNCNLL